MGKHRFLFPVLFFLLAAAPARGNVSLPKILGSNMVLQRNAAVSIWGWAEKGENVSVTFAGQQKSAVADADGKWMIKLAPMPASSQPATLTIRGNNTLVLNNVLVGEVWLCSGQSNMEYTMMKQSKFAQALRSTGLDSAALKTERNPAIRLFLVKRDLTKSDGGNVNKGWNAAEGEYLRAFSAAGYFFAKKLYAELGVPVGMIASSVSGSAIEPWLAGAVETDSLRKTMRINESLPGKFYLGMIKPLAPYTVKGFLWYQGETNCFLKETDSYTVKFKHLINSWRQLWNEPGASFYFVQLAPFAYSKSKDHTDLTETDLPAFRRAQAAALSLPHTGMIITTDLVDNTADIHPTYKWEIGRRLALLALAQDYHKKLVHAGPVVKKLEARNKAIEITFDQVGQGLYANDGKPLSSFEVAGVDGVYGPAEAMIAGNKVLVSAATVPSPVWVRFAWNETAQPNFFNKDGLPAAPFELTLDKTVRTKTKKD